MHQLGTLAVSLDSEILQLKPKHTMTGQKEERRLSEGGLFPKVPLFFFGPSSYVMALISTWTKKALAQTKANINSSQQLLRTLW